MVSEFKGVQVESRDNQREVQFSNILALPYFLAKIFLDSNSSAVKELWFLAILARKVFLLEYY